MFPLRDSHPAGIFPFWTIVIIVLNIWFFFQELTASDPNLFITQWALTPAIVDFSDLVTLIPFITSQFLHAGWLHIASNMWFLWIFGDNVEGHFGKIFYPVVYLVSGIVAGLTQYILNSDSTIPMLGASGAVAGILGAYMVLFSKHKIETLVFSLGLITTVEIPAGFMLLFWFIAQFFSGVGALSAGATGGVAWFAHVGGFVAGWLFAQLTRHKQYT